MTTPPPLLGGPAHYRRAVELLEQAENPRRYVRVERDPDDTRTKWTTGPFYVTPEPELPDVTPLLLAAQVHATLADVALRAEGMLSETGHRLVRRPTKADPDMGEPSFPGTPWGRAIYGDQ